MSPSEARAALMLERENQAQICGGTSVRYQMLSTAIEAIEQNALGLPPLEQAVGANTGHGHVRPRPDGVKMRCGGPVICKICALEQARLGTNA